jgi:hypothetical protein
MTALAEVFPVLKRVRRLPVDRDQAMLLLMAVNMFFLGIDTYLAHDTSGTIRSFEWIPIIFGPSAGVLLLLAGLLALRKRQAANSLASVVFLASILVGALGTYFHLHRALLPGGAPGEQVTFALFVWAPPLLGPLAFCLVGIMGLSAVWPEAPAGSGVLKLFFNRQLAMPYSKTQAYFFMVGLGVLTALVSSTLDHARTGFANPWLLIPLAAGIFGTVVPVICGFMSHPGRGDLSTFALTMLGLVLVGGLGAFLHVRADLAGHLAIVPERFLRGAPLLAPMLYANFGLLGIISLLIAEDHDGSQT